MEVAHNQHDSFVNKTVKIYFYTDVKIYVAYVISNVRVRNNFDSFGYPKLSYLVSAASVPQSEYLFL